MSEFINPDDYDASIHREILDSIIREDESIVEICEDQAVAQMRSYLSARYDCDRIFSARVRKGTRSYSCSPRTSRSIMYAASTTPRSSPPYARNVMTVRWSGSRRSARWRSA